jgi:hypothetical protein
VTQYLITVSTTSRHGRTKLHTFGKLLEAEHLGWSVETHASRKEVAQRRIPGVALPSPWPPPPRRDIGTAYYQPLSRHATLALTENFDIPEAMLQVILDALRRGDKHEVELCDLKTVRSQLGSRIRKLDTLGTEQRRHAEAALYNEILRRCTTI